jgi:hypothetical protein
MRCALRQGDDEAYHKWRIRVKNLYYELQTLPWSWHNAMPSANGLIRQAKASS